MQHTGPSVLLHGPFHLATSHKLTLLAISYRQYIGKQGTVGTVPATKHAECVRCDHSREKIGTYVGVCGPFPSLHSSADASVVRLFFCPQILLTKRFKQVLFLEPSSKSRDITLYVSLARHIFPYVILARHIGPLCVAE